jgi:superoxide reductase
MNRRDILKVTGITALAMTMNATASTKDSTKNRMEMSPKDPKKMEKGELKHTPSITVKDKDATGYTLVDITIGQDGVIHPSTSKHWIDFIELYADDKLVGKSILEGEISRGASCFSVKLDGIKTLKAKAGCNLHGIWTSTITL